MYNISNTITAEEVRKFRKRIGMTQKEFAAFLGVSTSSIERMEKNSKTIKGPEAMAINVLCANTDWLESQLIPERKTPIRLWYMYKDKGCTIIDVDEARQKVKIKNFVENIFFTAFGTNTKPTYDEYQEFLKSRCFPETRDKIQIYLDALGIPFYDPFLIIEKTEGRMAEDNFWIKIER